MNEIYSKNANLFDQVFSRKRVKPIRIKNLSVLFKDYNINSIIDIGCGSGRFANKLSKFGFEITGVDNSEEMISLAKERYSNSANTWICQDIFKFPSKIKYDCFLAMYSFIQTLPSDRYRDHFFNLTKKLLKPSGYGFIEMQNEKAIKKNHKFEKINHSKYFHYSIESFSTPGNSKYYTLHLIIKDINNGTSLVSSTFKIFYMNKERIEKMLKKYDFEILKFVDARDLSSEFCEDDSLEMGCFFKNKKD